MGGSRFCEVYKMLSALLISTPPDVIFIHLTEQRWAIDFPKGKWDFCGGQANRTTANITGQTGTAKGSDMASGS